jgi:hypothetical protein
MYLPSPLLFFIFYYRCDTVATDTGNAANTGCSLQIQEEIMDVRIRRAKSVVDDISSDTSVSPEMTVSRLLTVREIVDQALQCLKEDGVDMAQEVLEVE